eukprot:6727932-Prymnesium_polylepis.1
MATADPIARRAKWALQASAAQPAIFPAIFFALVALAISFSDVSRIWTIRSVAIVCSLFGVARVAFRVRQILIWKAMFITMPVRAAFICLDNALVAPEELVNRGQIILDNTATLTLCATLLGCILGAAQPSRELHQWKLRTLLAYLVMTCAHRTVAYTRTGDGRM